MPDPPGLGEPGSGSREALAPGGPEVIGVVGPDEEGTGKSPEEEEGDLARGEAGEADDHGQDEGQVRMSRRDREGEGQARPWDEVRILLPPCDPEEGPGEEEARRRMLPECLARGPEARPEGEEECA